MKVTLNDLAARLSSVGVTSAPVAPRRTPAAERAEAHRSKGNTWFAQRAYEQAAECYTAALTAQPGEPRALGNRAACYAALGRYGESLADADAAAKAQPQYAKAHSRRGLALWHMNRYHEAAEAYQKAMQLDASSADAKEGYERAVKAGGDARLAGHAREEVARKAAAAAPKPAPPPEVVAQQEARTAAAAAAAREAKYEAMMREYEQAKGKVNRQRLAAAAAWRASTGTDMQRPPVERGGSIHIDVFGTLRGACKTSGCTMWRRDIATAKNWSDTSVLTCQDCGESNNAHEDCGRYDLEDPPEPSRNSRHDDDLKKLKGVTAAY